MGFPGGIWRRRGIKKPPFAAWTKGGGVRRKGALDELVKTEYIVRQVQADEGKNSGQARSRFKMHTYRWSHYFLSLNIGIKIIPEIIYPQKNIAGIAWADNVL